MVVGQAPRIGCVPCALVLMLVIVASALPATAQPAGRVPTWPNVGTPNEPTESPFQDGFGDGLRVRGDIPIVPLARGPGDRMKGRRSVR